MRVATLQEHDLRIGRLFGLTPVSALRPEFSDVPPTFDQRLHVASTAARGAWRAVAFELPGRVDVDAWSRAVAAFMARHPALRSELLIGRDAQITSRLQYDATVSVRVEEHDFSADAETRRALLGEIIAGACRPTSWPASWFGAVERGYSSSFLAAFDRSLVDEASLWVALRDLHALYVAEARPAAGSEALAAVGSHLDAATEQESARVDLDSIEMSYWHDFLDRFGDTLPRSGFETGLRRDEQAPPVTSEHPLLSAGQLSWLSASLGSGAAGETVVLAAAALAHRRAGHAPGLTTLVPVDTRRRPEWAEALGPFATSVPLEIEAADSLRATLARASVAQLLAREMGRVSAGQVMAAAPRPVRWPHGDLNTVSWTDLRRMPGADLADLASATALRPEAPADDVQLELVRSRHGVLVRCRRPDTPEAHESFGRWLAELQSVLGEDGDRAVARPHSCDGLRS